MFESKVKNDEKVDIFRDDKYIVVQPLTHLASCKYGSDTGWCISVPSASYVWDDMKKCYNKNVIIIFIIQKNYHLSDEQITNIKRILYLKDLYDDGNISDEQEDIMLELMSDNDNYDLSKIALIFTNNTINPEIWDSNNIRIDDNYFYGYQGLGIDNYIKDVIEKYIKEIV